MTNKLASSAGNWRKSTSAISERKGSEIRRRPAILTDSTVMESFSLALRSSGRQGADPTYRRVLEYVSAFAADKGMPPLLYLATEHLREYFAAMYERDLQKSTVSIHHRACQQFYKWAVGEGERNDNPMERIKPPKVEEKIQAHVTIEEMHAVLKKLPAASREPRILRNRAIVLALYDTGLRGAELVGVRRDDVDFRTLAIIVRHAKGDREREVRISPLTAQALDRYLRRRNDLSPGLFVSLNGTPLTTNGLRMFLERLWAEAGLDFRGVHAFRRGFAIKSLENGMDPEDLRTLAGWESPQMLRRYTKATERQRAQKAHQRYSPVESLGLPR